DRGEQGEQELGARRLVDQPAKNQGLSPCTAEGKEIREPEQAKPWIVLQRGQRSPGSRKRRGWRARSRIRILHRLLLPRMLRTVLVGLLMTRHGLPGISPNHRCHLGDVCHAPAAWYTEDQQCGGKPMRRECRKRQRQRTTGYEGIGKVPEKEHACHASASLPTRSAKTSNTPSLCVASSASGISSSEASGTPASSRCQTMISAASSACSSMVVSTSAVSPHLALNATSRAKERRPAGPIRPAHR